MAVASYGSATDSSGVVRILKDLDAAIEGRDVLIVEDIVDSGLTLQYLLRNLGSRNPRSARGVRAADQARRGARSTCRPATWASRSPTASSSGYGLDYAERYRNLPFVAVLESPEGARRGPAGVLQAHEIRDCRGRLGAGGHELQTAPGTPQESRNEPFLQERRIPDPDRGGAGVPRRETGQPGPDATTARTATRRWSPRNCPKAKSNRSSSRTRAKPSKSSSRTKKPAKRATSTRRRPN